MSRARDRVRLFACCRAMGRLSCCAGVSTYSSLVYVGLV